MVRFCVVANATPSLNHWKPYGLCPPDTVNAIEPVAAPKQSALVPTNVVETEEGEPTTKLDKTALHPLASVTVTSYVPGAAL